MQWCAGEKNLHKKDVIARGIFSDDKFAVNFYLTQTIKSCQISSFKY